MPKRVDAGWADLPAPGTRQTAAGCEDHSRRKLSDSEEAAIVQWILSMDNRGLPPRPSTVRSIANLLLEKRGDGNSEPIGQLGHTLHTTVSRDQVQIRTKVQLQALSL